jgi:transposase
LSDEEWGVISSFLPPKPKRGRRALSNDRSLINATCCTTGFRYVGMPRKYGSYVTVWRRLRRLQEARVWGRIVEFPASMRSCKRAAIDSTTWMLKGGEEVGYDGFRIGGG